MVPLPRGGGSRRPFLRALTLPSLALKLTIEVSMSRSPGFRGRIQREARQHCFPKGLWESGDPVTQ